jgi:hypothetical protein
VQRRAPTNQERNDWSSETTISTMSRAYSEWPAGSIATIYTVFLVATVD